MLQLHGDANVHVLRVSPTLSDLDPSDTPTEYDVATMANKINAIARNALSEMLDSTAIMADKARRATRATFRSWFTSTSSSSATALRVPHAMQPSSPTRRTSFGAAARTPLFDPASTEALTRRHADLAYMSRRYSEAADAYALLATDCRVLTGLAVVHEAGALEMTALSRIHLDAPRNSILSALERAMLAYVRASRPELAIRATLRALTFCSAIGNSEAAISFIIRAREAIAPGAAAPSATPTGNAYIDAALAVLSTACITCYARLGKRRRSSLYAFIAMKRFASLQFTAIAARVAAEVDQMALRHGNVAQHVDLVLATHAAKSGRTRPAVGHYSNLFRSVTESMDVELQGAAVRGFLSTVAGGAIDDLANRWDGGISFPSVSSKNTTVFTRDTGEDDVTWRTLEDDVLEDVAYFRALRKSGRSAVPKRERRIDTVSNELRRRDARQGSVPIGGSVEMKIRRLREMAHERRKNLRRASLLERGAVAGDRMRLQTEVSNPLQFPIFMHDVCAVVSLNGVVHSAYDNGAVDEGEGDCQKSEVVFFPVEGVTLVPCSSQVVSVDILAKSAGTLSFIGMTWRFTIGMGSASIRAPTPVPGFCHLEKRGHRLNKTRHQRASEVPLYEPDVSLSLNVVAKAPRLSTRLVNKSGREFGSDECANALSLRAGEMQEARLVIINEGEDVVDDVVIRIGTPHAVFIDMTPTTVCKNDATIACAIAPDDTVPLPGEVVIAAETRLNIAGKGKAEIPVWVRAGVPASAFVNSPSQRRGRRPMSAREQYEVLDDGLIQCRGRVALAYGQSHIRICRINMRLNVRRSIVVSPRFMRQTDPVALYGESGRGLKGVLLGVEVEHAGRTAAENIKFEVFEVCVTSHLDWRPMLLPEADEPADKPAGELVPSQSSLRINETATIFTLLVSGQQNGMHPEPNGGDTETKGEARKSVKSQWQSYRTLLTREVNVGEMGTEVINGLHGGYEKGSVRASGHFALCGHATMAATMAEAKDLVHLSVGWRTGDGVIGEIHIPPIDPVRWMRPSGNICNGEVRGMRGEKHGTPGTVISNGLEGNTVAGSGEVSDGVVVTVEHVEEMTHDFFTDPLSRTVPSTSSSSADNANITVIAAAATTSGGATNQTTQAAGYFPAEVAVQVGIKNTCGYVVDILFSATPIGGIGDGDRGRQWAGDISMSLRAVPPNAERVVALTAIVIAPGRFNVSRFSVLSERVGTDGVKVRRAVGVAPSFVTVAAARGFDKNDDDGRSGGKIGMGDVASPLTTGSESAASVCKGSVGADVDLDSSGRERRNDDDGDGKDEDEGDENDGVFEDANDGDQVVSDLVTSDVNGVNGVVGKETERKSEVGAIGVGYAKKTKVAESRTNLNVRLALQNCDDVLWDDGDTEDEDEDDR